MKRIVFRWLKVILLIYCLLGIAIYYLQDSILFGPEPLEKDYKYKFDRPYTEVNLPYNARSTINIIQFPAKDTAAKGVVLYFHGSRKNIAHYAAAAPEFTNRGYHVWMMDYPGFGKSTGQFTEQQLYDWALVLYKLARARYSADSIVIYGKSMGTGIASQLASIRNSKALMLEGAYYSLPSIIGSWLPIYPVNNMIRIKLPAWQYLQQVSAPVIIFHGSNDRTIPYSNASRLRPCLKPHDLFVRVEGGHHNDLRKFGVFQQTLDSLLK